MPPHHVCMHATTATGRTCSVRTSPLVQASNALSEALAVFPMGAGRGTKHCDRFGFFSGRSIGTSAGASNSLAARWTGTLGLQGGCNFSAALLATRGKRQQFAVWTSPHLGVSARLRDPAPSLLRASDTKMQCQRMQVGAPARVRVAASSMMPLRAHGPRRSSTIAAAAPRLPVGLVGLAVIMSHPHQAIAQARSEAGVSAHQTAPRLATCCTDAHYHPVNSAPGLPCCAGHLWPADRDACRRQCVWPWRNLWPGRQRRGWHAGLRAEAAGGREHGAAAIPTRTGSKKRITLEPATSPPTSPTCTMHKHTSSVPLHPAQHPSLHV